MVQSTTEFCDGDQSKVYQVQGEHHDILERHESVTGAGLNFPFIDLKTESLLKVFRK